MLSGCVLSSVETMLKHSNLWFYFFAAKKKKKEILRFSVGRTALRGKKAAATVKKKNYSFARTDGFTWSVAVLQASGCHGNAMREEQAAWLCDVAS